MNASPTPRRPLWYSSFYWRIAVSFVLFVVVVLVGQGVMVTYMARADAFAPGNPNALAATIAAEVGAALAGRSDLDVEDHLRRAYSHVRQPMFVVLKDGQVSSPGRVPLRDEIRQQAEAMLSGLPPVSGPGDSPTGPVVTAPIQVDGELRGMVILPPPPRRGMLADVGELLSLPGMLVLLAATAIATIAVFAPARIRLRALEDAAERLGGGHLDARAPEGGRDEIARVASAFNRMAADLTARTDALHASDRLRRQMLADVSHELRTPLTTIRGYLDTLDMPDVALDEETRRRYLETVRAETRRLERIVADLLELARYQGGMAALDPRIFSIERLFASVARRFERDAATAGVEIRMHIADSADQLIADPDRLDQAVSNLVANALRYTPSGGTISLEAAVTGDGYQVAVIDTGAGIPSEHLPYVFDRFYKADASRAASGGSGLGLSIVKAIVERHGGTIAVTSRPGRTVFLITLPQQGGSDSSPQVHTTATRTSE